MFRFPGHLGFRNCSSKCVVSLTIRSFSKIRLIYFNILAKKGNCGAFVVCRSLLLIVQPSSSMDILGISGMQTSGWGHLRASPVWEM